MKKIKRQSGFSLLEVMMAVVVMTMGMVFVASMFPVGLNNARKTAEATIQNIESKNAAVLSDLSIGDALSDAVIDRQLAWATAFTSYREAKDFNYDFVFNRKHSDGTTGLYNYNGYYPASIHQLARPNVFCDTGNVFFADTEFEYSDNLSVVFNSTAFNFYYLTDSSMKNLTAAVAVSHLSHPMATFYDVYSAGPNYQFVNYTSSVYGSSISFLTASNSKDIGKIMCPPIDETDTKVMRRVEQLVFADGGSSYDLNVSADRTTYLYPAIYDISMEQNFNSAIFYQETSSRNDSDGGLPDKMFIFVLKRSSEGNVRYAMQNPSTMVLSNREFPYQPYVSSGGGSIGVLPSPLESSFDCVFPVPWLVYLDKPAVNTAGDSNSSAINVPARNGSVFGISDSVEKILRKGSILLDADPVNSPWFNSVRIFNNSGKVFEVRDIRLDIDDEDNDSDTTDFVVELSTNLSDGSSLNSLFCFWVFPPSITRYPDGTYEFGENQPVVDVVIKPFEIDDF